MCDPALPDTLQDALQRSMAFFTISSASGIEALRWGVPTFTLAPSFYTRPGLAQATAPAHAHALRHHIEGLHLVRRGSSAIDQFLTAVDGAFGAELPAHASPRSPAYEVAKRIRQLRRAPSCVSNAANQPTRPEQCCQPGQRYQADGASAWHP